MKNLKSFRRRGPAVLLSLAVCAGMFNITAFAEESVESFEEPAVLQEAAALDESPNDEANDSGDIRNNEPGDKNSSANDENGAVESGPPTDASTAAPS